MIRRTHTLPLLVALLVAGCAGKKVTEIVVVVATDIPIGTGAQEINRLTGTVLAPCP